MKEAAALLVCAPAKIIELIETGLALTRSDEIARLQATGTAPHYVISDQQLDEFIAVFAADDPARNPPVAVRRKLRVEARHACAICRRDLPLQFHHILGWSKVPHHDPRSMLAVCGGCHDKIGSGQIDAKEQLRYKLQLTDFEDASSRRLNPLSTKAFAAIDWNDLRDVIRCIHETVSDTSTSADSRFDFSDVDLHHKNALNSLSDEFFALMRDDHEPYFARIHEFLQNPNNSTVALAYHETVDEIRHRIAAHRMAYDHFEHLLLDLHDIVKERFGDALKGKKRTLRILISFMYFNCDIGRKK